MSTSTRWLALGIALAAIVRAADIPRAEHPRPDFQRDEWVNLNGGWDFRFDSQNRGLVNVGIAGESPEPFDLPDDPADSRGVLSSHAGPGK